MSTFFLRFFFLNLMDCDEKQSLIVALLSICGLLAIVLIVVLYFIWADFDIQQNSQKLGEVVTFS